MDEFIRAFIEAATKEGMKPPQNTGFSNNPNPVKVDTGKMAKQAANGMKQLYDAYMEAGFTEQQAFKLVSSAVPHTTNLIITVKKG